MNNIDINKLIEISNEETIYLIEKITDKIGFFAYDKHFVFLELNNDNESSGNIKTECLSLYINIKISSDNMENSFKNGNYNIILYEGIYNDENFETFISLCRIYAMNSEEISFKDFFNSLVSLFQLPKEQKLLNGIGLFGELKFIQFVKDEYNLDITKFWHTNGVYSKYDFNFKDLRIECKTTVGDKNTITIKHEQIFSSEKTILVKISCNIDDNGESIENMHQKLLSKKYFYNNLKFSISLMREIRRISIDDYKNLKLVLKGIDFYYSDEINPFIAIPDNVSSINYQLNMSKYTPLGEDIIKDILEINL